MTAPKHILKDVFGYESFRGKQEQVINHIIESNNALVIMPTGSGKSILYQIPTSPYPI